MSDSGRRRNGTRFKFTLNYGKILKNRGESLRRVTVRQEKPSASKNESPWSQEKQLGGRGVERNGFGTLAVAKPEADSGSKFARNGSKTLCKANSRSLVNVVRKGAIRARSEGRSHRATQRDHPSG